MSNRRPWWQAANTARQGFWLGGVFAFLGVAWISLKLGHGNSAWSLVPGVLWLVLSAGYLISAEALRRRV